MAASSLSETQRAQLVVCERFNLVPEFPMSESMSGVSSGFGSGEMPLNGLRHPAGDGANGWFLWSGETLSESADFFQPLHYEHLTAREPSVIPYLALPPGWRFLVADGYEDVWFDESLLAPTD